MPGGWQPDGPQNPENEECQQCKEMKKQLLKTEADARDREMELKKKLFESCKSAGEFDKAGKHYKDLLEDLMQENGVEKRVLDLKQSYVDMLIKQGGRFDEAVPLAEKVWEERKCRDPTSDVSKESHRQLCSIYASLKWHDQAESRHRIAYEQYKGLDHAWALENGDECCKQLAEQQKYDEAALMQARVWKERQMAGSGGPKHRDTIKSGKSRIELLEKLSVALADQAGSESQQVLRRSKREVCEQEIDEALEDIWKTAESPERDTEILDVGHKLGDRLFARMRVLNAEEVLDQVWQGRRLVAGEADPQAMSTGKLLATVVKLQDSTEKYRKAAAIYSQLWKVCKRVFGQGDDETISVGMDLAATLDHLEQYSGDEGAEEVYGWVLEQKQIYSRKATSTVVDARYNLGRARYRQGLARYAEAAGPLQDVYDQWYEKPPDAASIRECGHMLVKIYEHEIYEHQGVVDPLKALFDGRRRLEPRGILYLESGYAYGRVLMEVVRQEGHTQAREMMKSLWEYNPAFEQEKAFHLKCGRLYGEILLKIKDHDLARDVLQDVMNAQDGVFKAGSTEVTKVSQYLREARLAISARPILSPRDRKMRGVPRPRKHAVFR